jgi:hypothetical protein
MSLQAISNTDRQDNMKTNRGSDPQTSSISFHQLTSGLTYGTILLLASPYMTATPMPTLNFPFGGSVSSDYGLARATVYDHPMAIPDENSQFRALEVFATNLLAKTEDLDINIARALREDFLYLYEPI